MTEADYKLCYVEGSFAYFTPRSLTEQWGDDWNDAPYEHNAGHPYEDDIIKVAFDGDFDAPSEGYTNSPYSVEQINRGAVAWLRTSRWSSRKPFVAISAGVNILEFCRLIREGGGKVYMEKRE